MEDDETGSENTNQSNALASLKPTKDASRILSSSICLSSPLERFREEFGSSPTACELIIRSLLLRAQYGGMTGDMRMIDGYVRLWRKRFLLPCVQNDVAKRLCSSHSEHKSEHTSPATLELKWWSVPGLVHERAKIQSAKHIATLATHGLEKLSIKDVCVEGVDFHCSAVLTVIVSDPELYAICCKDFCSIRERTENTPVPTGADQRRSWVLDVLKECMWKFSSGVNLRRPLQEDHSIKKCVEERTSHRNELLKRFWDESIFKRAQNYMKNYVEDRLFR